MQFFQIAAAAQLVCLARHASQFGLAKAIMRLGYCSVLGNFGHLAPYPASLPHAIGCGNATSHQGDDKAFEGERALSSACFGWYIDRSAGEAEPTKTTRLYLRSLIKTAI